MLLLKSLFYPPFLSNPDHWVLFSFTPKLLHKQRQQEPLQRFSQLPLQIQAVYFIRNCLYNTLPPLHAPFLVSKYNLKGIVYIQQESVNMFPVQHCFTSCSDLFKCTKATSQFIFFPPSISFSL